MSSHSKFSSVPDRNPAGNVIAGELPSPNGKDPVLIRLVLHDGRRSSGKIGRLPLCRGRAQWGDHCLDRYYCRAHGATVEVLPGPEGDRCNLFATVGPRDKAGYILSGHMDVVPAGEAEWSSDPFSLRSEGDRRYGRGTTDMKGFLACALAALPKLVASNLSRPIHLAFSYDEEAGCRGVPHLIAALPHLCQKPLGAIIGEPSRMQAVRAHKGKAAVRLEVIGRSGHSSQPHLGLNAVHAMAGVITKAVAYGELLAEGPFDHNFEPPYSSLQVGVIAGGQAVNIIPDRCTADIELRAVSGTSPLSLLEPVKAELEALQAQDFRTIWHELSAYPALSLAADSPLAGLLAELTGKVTLAAVSYGTSLCQNADGPLRGAI